MADDNGLSEAVKAELSDDEIAALRQRDGWTKGIVKFVDEMGNSNRPTRVWVKDKGLDDGADVYGVDGSNPGIFAYYSLDDLEADERITAGWVLVSRGEDSWSSN